MYSHKAPKLLGTSVVKLTALSPVDDHGLCAERLTRTEVSSRDSELGCTHCMARGCPPPSRMRHSLRQAGVQATVQPFSVAGLVTLQLATVSA